MNLLEKPVIILLHNKRSPKQRGSGSSGFLISSLIQTVLSVLESHQISRFRGSRTLPPVGNCTLPRRIFFYLFLLYSFPFRFARAFCQSSKATAYPQPKRFINSISMAVLSQCLFVIMEMVKLSRISKSLISS